MSELAAPAAVGQVGGQMVRVNEKVELADGVVRLRLSAADGRRLPDWNPGAHIELAIPAHDDEVVLRQYSLCGDRWSAGTYDVAVLREPASRGGSHYIHDELAVGDLVAMSSPRNNFSLAPARSYQFIAGGIGITPIMAMIASADQQGIPWHLTYGGRTRASIAFVDELSAYGDRVTIWPQDERGLLDLTSFATPVEFSKVYCCGPEPLLEAVRIATSAWPERDVRFERFVAAVIEPPVRPGPFTVELRQSGKTLTVAPSESILDVLGSAGIPVVSSCREGVCGTCEVGVLAGVPDHRDSLLSSAERARNDRLFACVSRSATDTLVLDL